MTYVVHGGAINCILLLLNCGLVILIRPVFVYLCLYICIFVYLYICCNILNSDVVIPIRLDTKNFPDALFNIGPCVRGPICLKA